MPVKAGEGYGLGRLRSLLCLLLGCTWLSACSVNPYHEPASSGGGTPPRPVISEPEPEPEPTVEKTPSYHTPIRAMPAEPQAAATPPARQQSHPRYAPPPQGSAYWDNSLGVYVLEGQNNLFYRERLYYRQPLMGGWQCASKINGPWEDIPLTRVPPGLRR